MSALDLQSYTPPTRHIPIVVKERVLVMNSVHDLLESIERTVELQPGSLRVVPMYGGKCYVYRVISLDSVAGTVKFDYVIARNDDEVPTVMALPGEREWREDTIEHFLLMTGGMA